MTKFLDMDREQLINDTIEKLKQYTDRKIEVRVKKQNGEYNSMPLLQQLEDTHAVVSFQSNGAMKAIQHVYTIVCGNARSFILYTSF